MPISSEIRRSVPPFPDPRDTDQGRINRQITELVRYLMTTIEQGRIEERITIAEDKINEFEDIING